MGLSMSNISGQNETGDLDKDVSRSFCFNGAHGESFDRLEYECGILKKVEDWRAGRLETASLDELEKSLGTRD